MSNGLYNGLDNGLHNGVYNGMDNGIVNGLYSNETFFKKKLIIRNLVLHESPLNYNSFIPGYNSVKDLSVNSVTGTLYNVTQNRISKGWVFNGSSSYIDTGKSLKAYSFNDYYTVSAWAKYTASQTGFIFSQREQTSNFGSIAIAVAGASDFSSAGTKIVLFDGGGATVNRQTISTKSYNDNRWHQIVLVKDIMNDILFIDGVQIAISNTQQIIYGPANSKTFLGVAGSNLIPLGSPSWFFNGEIGEVMFMETILKANEVRHNFEATRLMYGV